MANVGGIVLLLGRQQRGARTAALRKASKERSWLLTTSWRKGWVPSRARPWQRIALRRLSSPASSRWSSPPRRPARAPSAGGAAATRLSANRSRG